MTNPLPLRLAATCIPIRSRSTAPLEVLMVRRNPELSFGGLWTFPGGVFEDNDGPAPASPDEHSENWGHPQLLAIAANAAVRETVEETELHCDVSSLAWFSHWIPPLVGPPKRFATWFFLAPEHHGDIVVNTDENDEARWIAPADALDQSTAGDFPLTIPTWVTLDDLRVAETIPLLIDRCITQGATQKRTRAFPSGDERVICWSGDAAYEADTPDVPGPRNRVRATKGGSVIERIVS